MKIAKPQEFNGANFIERVRLRQNLRKVKYIEPQNPAKHHQIYNLAMLRHITKLAKTSIDKATDMAGRLKENATNMPNCGKPNDWKYLMDIYNKDFSFIQACFPDTSLKDIEALYHAHERTSSFRKSALNNSTLPNNIKYLMLDLKDEYPKQVDIITATPEYMKLFGNMASNVPDMKTARAFADLLKNEPNLANHILTNINKSPLANTHNFTVPEFLFYVETNEKSPDSANALLMKDVSPELIKILVKHANKTDVLAGYDLFNEFFAPEYDRDFVDNNPHRKYSLPVKKEYLNDFDKFLDFFAKLINTLKDKENECIPLDKQSKAYTHIARKMMDNIELDNSFLLDEFSNRNMAIAFTCRFYSTNPRFLFKQATVKNMCDKNPKFLLNLLKNNETFDNGAQGLYLIENCQHYWDNEYIRTRYS